MTIGLEEGIVRLEQYSPEWKMLYEKEEKLFLGLSRGIYH